MSKVLKGIFEEHYSSLCNYAHVYLKDRHLAEDVVQSIFVQLWKNDKLAGLKEPAPYLMRCVKYKCLDFLKSSYRKQEVFSGELPETANTSQTLTEEEVLPLLHYFVDQLPAKMRRVFLLSRVEEMSYKQIAAELDVSIKTVENQMGSALKKLRILLKAHHFLPLLALFL